MFSPDAPIRSAKEDLLGRANFVSALTRAILGTAGSESYVTGIHGKWGTGKSSVMNLIVEQITEHNKSKPDEEKASLLRFNPWNFADQNQLVFQFLRQFRAHLQNFKGSSSGNAGKLIEALDEYEDALAPTLELIPYGGKILSLGMKLVLKRSRKSRGSPKEIEEIFYRLVTESARLKRRTVVLIDDIDRLNATEIRQIFQLVKATAPLPYVTYVLAFDRTAVASALKEDSGVASGEEYLEKIVQVAFELPAISETAFAALITEGIDSLLAKYPPAHFDTARFGSIFPSFRACFASVRHVRRFLNHLEFSLSLIGRELNGVDIIGIEALRTFYPLIFEVVRSNKDLFAGHIDPITEKLGAAEYRKKLDQVLPPVGEGNENLRSLLTKLFPKMEYGLEVSRTLYGHGWETEWEKTHRVATERYFDAYFQLALASSEVSVSEVSHLIHDCVSEADFFAALRGIKDRGKLKAGMESLRFRLQEVPAQNLPALLGALISTGEIASQSGVLLARRFPEYWYVRWAIFDVLDRIPAEDRHNCLLEIARRTLAPRTLVNVTALLEQLRRENRRYEEFTDERLTEIRSAITQRIRTAAANGEISEAGDNLVVLLYAWRQWGDAAEARAYVQSLTDTDAKLARFLDKFIYQTLTHSAVATETHNRLAMKQLSESLDLGALEDRLSRVNFGQLGEADRVVLRFASEQLKRMHEKGLTPEQFDDSRLLLD